jgi:hypothetical protein
VVTPVGAEQPTIITTPGLYGSPVIFKFTRKGSTASASPTFSWTVGGTATFPSAGTPVNDRDYDITVSAIGTASCPWCPVGTGWPLTPSASTFDFSLPAGVSDVYFTCYIRYRGFNLDPTEGEESITLECTTLDLPIVEGTILDTGISPVAVSITDPVAIDGSTTDKASFKFIRVNNNGTVINCPPFSSACPQAAATTVYFELFGQAILGTDYTISAPSGNLTHLGGNKYQITIPENIGLLTSSGLESAIITVSPTSPETTPEGIESIIVKILPESSVGTLFYEKKRFGALRIVDPGANSAFIPDTDGDGVDDVTECTVTFTDPLLPDSDGDGVVDNYFSNFAPHQTTQVVPDSDKDGISNFIEYLLRVLKTDSDGDTVTNFREISLGRNPTVDDNSADVTAPTIILTIPASGPVNQGYKVTLLP